MATIYNQAFDATGREAAYAAAELCILACWAMNRTETEDTAYPSLVSSLAMEYQTAERTTPMKHARLAWEGILKVLAREDGFNESDVLRIVDRAGDISSDLMGEGGEARRGYQIACEDLVDDAWSMAEMETEDRAYIVSLAGFANVAGDLA